MIFKTRFKVGDMVWSDFAASYHSLVNTPNSLGSINNVSIIGNTPDGNIIVGVSLVRSPVTEIYVSKYLTEAGVLQNSVGYIVENNSLTYSETNEKGRGCWETEEEANYYAYKAYVKRLDKLIKQTKIIVFNKVSDYTPSAIAKHRDSLKIFTNIRAHMLTKIGIRPKVKRTYSILKTTKLDVGQTVWTVDTADLMIDDYDYDSFYLEDTAKRVLKVFSQKPKAVIVNGIRNVDNEETRYDFNVIGEVQESCLFTTAEEAETFFKENTFINRQSVKKSEYLQKFLGKLNEKIAGDISPRNKFNLEDLRDNLLLNSGMQSVTVAIGQ